MNLSTLRSNFEIPPFFCLDFLQKKELKTRWLIDLILKWFYEMKMQDWISNQEMPGA